MEVTFTFHGRALRAIRAVKKGEVIFADKPMLLAQTLPTLKFPCCAHCVKSLIRPEEVFSPEELGARSALGKAVKRHWPLRERVPCSCGREVYCSEACRREAWETYHRLICPEKNAAARQLHEVCSSFPTLTADDCSAFQGWWSASFSPVLMAKLWAHIVCGAVRLARDGGRASPSAPDWALARAPYRR